MMLWIKICSTTQLLALAIVWFHLNLWTGNLRVSKMFSFAYYDYHQDCAIIKPIQDMWLNTGSNPLVEQESVLSARHV